MYTLNLTTLLLKISFIFTFTCFSLTSYAQRAFSLERCIRYKPSLDFEKWLVKKAKSNDYLRTTDEIITIPVVVHVIHNGEAIGEGTNISQAQIESQIRILNEDFRKKINTNGYNTHPAGADIEINFQLAIQSPEGIPTDGIVRIKGTQSSWGVLDEPTLKALSFWNPEHYLNIWVCNLSGALGYAQFPETDVLGVPQNSSTTNALTDGVVVDYQAFGDTDNVNAPFDKGRTATHEVGHYLGLLHISGDDFCPTDDFCTDTPPVNDQTRGCPSPIPLACDGSVAQIENYMDYTDDRCMNMFTQQQKTRMRTVLANSPRRKTLKDSPGLQAVVLVPNNAGIVFITQVQNSSCDVDVNPKIVIRNFGNNSLTSLTITYDIDGANTQSISWQGNLASLDTTTIELPASQTTRTTHQLNVQLSMPNGQTDADNSNNTQNASFTVEPLLSLPYSYNFADTAILNKEWKIVNPDNLETWTPITVSVQNQSSGNEVITLPYFDYSQTGQEDQLITPLIDASNAQQLLLQFKVAHAPFQTGDEISRDGLKVGVSTDCGQTFTIIYEKYGDTLATDDPVMDNWKPIRENQWRTEILNLNKWAGKGNLQIGFIGVNDYGNNIFLDDVFLTPAALSNNPEDFVAVFPNPVSDNQIKFSLRLPQAAPTLDWTLYDIKGKKVTSGQVVDAQFQSVTIPKQARLTGVYILKISTDQFTVSKRVVIL